MLPVIDPMDSSESDYEDSDDDLGFGLFDDIEEFHRVQPRRGKELCTCGATFCMGGKGVLEQAKEGVLVRATQRNDAAQVAALLTCAGCWPDRVLQRALKSVASEKVARVFAFAAPTFWERGGGAGALLWAAVEGRVEAVRTLLAAGVQPDAEAPWEKAKALPAACQQGHSACVEVLLEHGADPKCRLEYAFTPLHLAALSGDVRSVEALLRCGAKVGAKSSKRFTPLHLAARAGAALSVRALLDAGADPNARCNKKNTPMHMAAMTSKYYIKTPSRYRFEQNSVQSSLTNFPECVLELAKREAYVNAANYINFTPLFCAVEKGDVGVARELLDNGANLQHRITDGDTVVHHAAMSRTSIACLMEVLRRPEVPHIDTPNDSGYTPLHLTIRRWRQKGAEELLRLGADVAARDARGYTPLHIAADIGCHHIVPMLLRAGADTEAVATDEALTPLHVGAETTLFVKALLEGGANINAQSANGRTALHFVSDYGLEQLLAHGADPQARDDAGWNALHHAAQIGSGPNIELLLKHGLSLDDRTDDGRTPLHVATASMQTYCVAHLLWGLGADANERDAAGRTPLHVAARASDEETARVLLIFGAQRGARDHFGDTPADAAVVDSIRRLIRLWAVAA